MTEEQFVEQFSKIPNPREKYADAGFDESFLEKFLAAYRPKKRGEVLDGLIKDPLIQLVKGYDVSKSEIGMIWFGNDVRETEDYYFVGKFEVDYLCVSKFSYEVVIIPFDAPLNIAFRCAQNSSLFLDAVIDAARFLEACIIGNAENETQHARCKYSHHCALKAGGEIYLDFYRMLLGCFE